MGKPKPPNPTKVAEAQAKANLTTAQEQAKLNAIAQYGPFGSTTYQFDPSTGAPTAQQITLSPEVQGLLDQQFALSGGLGEAAQAQLGLLPTSGFSLSDVPDTSQIGQTSFDYRAGLLDPKFQDAEKAMEIRLSERGIPIGSEIYSDERNRFERQRGEALTQAARQAQLDASQEQQRLLQNKLTERQVPYDELARIRGLTPSTQLPQFQQAPQTSIAGTDVTGPTYQSYQQQVANANATGQGLFGLASAALPLILSDENMKKNRRPADGEMVLALLRGMPAEEFDYKEEAQENYGVPRHRTGVMAQDYSERFGGDDRSIDLGDFVGKLLAAVQALDKRTQMMAA